MRAGRPRSDKPPESIQEPGQGVKFSTKLVANWNEIIYILSIFLPATGSRCNADSISIFRHYFNLKKMPEQ